MCTIDTPGIPEMKQVDLYQNYCRFMPDYFHHFIYPKPSDKMISNIKDYCQCVSQKRIDKIKMMKGEKVIVDDEDDKDFEDDKKKQCSVVAEDASVVAVQKNENPVVESLLL